MGKTAARQLTLWPPPNLWVARFGPALFRRIPAQPGVYLLGDGQGRLLYVGKAVNLRRRLQSYLHLPLERCSRKTARLIRETHAISWEVLPGAAAALLRENELLRLWKPKFNRLNTRPEQYARVALAQNAAGARVLRWGRGHPPTEASGPWYGAFKGPGRLRDTLRALARLTWCIAAIPPSLHQLPRLAYAEKLPPEIPLPTALPAPLQELALWEDFFAGRRPELLAQLAAHLPPNLPPDVRRMAERDLARLQAFYEAGPRRNRQLSERAGLEGAWIAPDELDDLLALELAQRQNTE
ncbi:GIY-YIG nuclease family protein [Fontisphaera persica]|uniref:GIY-YIG nuclease family protein n=1 Tax=Fontisphaera persica TaxID=2974023 RepID=UPI0024C0082B|nr:GIY-YIG nuclease family protein [Fontisphaera persica]WCJ58967.1 GIY-YIG nuclease family protein [Fontisphaera persica]